MTEDEKVVSLDSRRRESWWRRTRRALSVEHDTTLNQLTQIQHSLDQWLDRHDGAS